MIYLLIAAFLWGTSFVAGKFAEEVTDVVIIVAVRLIIASIFIIPIAVRFLKKIDPLLFVKLIGVSFLTFPVTFTLQFIGLKYTTASSAAIIIGFEPLLIVLLGYVFFKEKAMAHDFIFSIIALLGIFLVIGMPTEDEFHILGCILVFLSTIVVAIWVRWSKLLMNEVPERAYTPITLLFGAILSIPVALIFANNWTFNPTLSGVSAILYLGIGCSLIAGWAWNKGLTRTRTNTSGLFLALEPVFGVLFGVLLLKDHFDFYGSIGIGLVVASVFLSIILTLNKKK